MYLSLLHSAGPRKPLRAFFSSLMLTRISSDSIRNYIAHRKQKGAANRTLNMELGILRRILKRAKRWHLLAEDIKPLPERHNVGQALQHGEKVKLLKAAASRPEWQLARLAAILELRERSKLLLGSEPVPIWYLFPRGEGQGPVAQPKSRPGPAVSVIPDPTKPMTTWRTAWRNLSKEAGLPDCDSMTCAITLSRSSLSQAPAIKRSWRLLDTSPRRCSLTTRTSVWTPNVKHWMLSRRERKTQLRHKPRHKKKHQNRKLLKIWWT